MAIGDNIKLRRYQLRMSQQELADAMGYKTRSTIAKIESGENDVSHKKLQKFAAVLDTTVEALMSGRNAVPFDSAAPDVSELGRNKHVAVILAGGTSGKSVENIPSQFINVHGKPIIVYAMEAYQAHPAIHDIVVVCLKGWEKIVKAYADQYGITKLSRLIPAGNSGVDSLKNAIEYIGKHYSKEDYVVIQEATRPRVSVETISNLLRMCYEKGSATICHSMQEYVQFYLNGDRAEYVDRNAMIALQSPEAHRLALLQEVFESAEKQNHPLMESCCTMLMYHLGFTINFVTSSVNNIKITRDEDLAAFAALVEKDQDRFIRRSKV